MTRKTYSKKIVKCTDKIQEYMVGGKFKKQEVMLKNKLPIPEFFCLTGNYFEEKAGPIKNEIVDILNSINYNNNNSVKKASRDIIAKFNSINFSEKEKKRILKYFDSMFGKDSLVSVRASMIGYRPGESEDSIDNPFAGISESFLYVKRDELFAKIRLCWSSGFSEEAILYRKNQDMSTTAFAVSVGVQKMIFGEKSFVLFTCNPQTMADDSVVVAGYGIGEGIVQERVATDHYFKIMKSGEIESTIAKKDSKLTFNKSKGSGLKQVPVNGEMQNAQCLTNEEIDYITSFGKKIEKIFGHPQDIEGTFTSDGSLYILQSRPVAIDYSRMRLWSNLNITESFPGVSTALTYSLAKYFYDVIFYHNFKLNGESHELLRSNMKHMQRFVGYVRGRIYYSLSAMYHLYSMNPLFFLFKAHWEQHLGFTSSYQTKPPGILATLLAPIKKVFSVIRSLFILFYRYFTHGRKIKKFHLWWENLMSQLRGKSFDKSDLLSITEIFYDVWTEVGSNWGYTLVNDSFLLMIHGYMEALFKKWGLHSKDPSLLNDLLCGDEELLSVEIIYSAIRIAESVNKDEKLKNIFSKKTSMEIWKLIEEKKLDIQFCMMVDKHLFEYGDRGLQELKMEQPNIRHTPWVLINMIMGYVSSGLTVEEFRERERSVRKKAEKRLKMHLNWHPFKRMIARAGAKRIRRLIRVRENSRYCRSELFGLSKNIFRAIGNDFTHKGILKSKDYVMHLTMEEIFGYIDGTGVTEDLNAVANIRKKEFKENQNYETPEMITTIGPLRNNVLEKPGAKKSKFTKELKGLGSTAGKVTGKAHVVTDPNNPPKITDDMILVAKETDPGWMFLMLAAKGIIVERGSMLSHTAITGRKFNIPTIVALPDATSLIPNGGEIEMDGGSGTVTILKNKGTKK